MFPQVELSRIEEVIMIYGVGDGVGVLLEEAVEEETSPGQSMLDLPNQSSLQTILFEHAHQTMDHSREMYLKIKDTLWQQAVSFYKELKTNEGRLHRDLTVEFDGEEGSDAGALKITFFELMMRSVNTELFEGKDEKRIPKKDWGLEGAMEMAGMMVGHSIMCGGPGFNCLHPAYYSMLHIDSTNPESLQSEFIPSVEDIPEALAYSDLLELIEQVAILLEFTLCSLWCRSRV